MKINNLKQWWPLAPLRSIRKFNSGVINDTYSVTTAQGKFVLRIYTRKTASAIAFELALLKRLKGLPVPEIVRAEGTRIIYKYIPGACPRQLIRAQREQVGQFLARLHRQGRNFRWNGRRAALYDFPKQKIKLFSNAVSLARLPYRHCFNQIKEDIHRYKLPAKLPSGPIHVDVKPENVLFNKGKLSGVIDFDNACLGPFILDLAKSMVWFGLDGKKFNLARAADIYHGYIKKRNLTGLEYQQLYRAIKFAFASHLFVDFYMRAMAGIPARYFNWLMQNFYSAYQSFSQTSEEFYALL